MEGVWGEGENVVNVVGMRRWPRVVRPSNTEGSHSGQIVQRLASENLCPSARRRLRYLFSFYSASSLNLCRIYERRNPTTVYPPPKWIVGVAYVFPRDEVLRFSWRPKAPTDPLTTYRRIITSTRALGREEVC